MSELPLVFLAERLELPASSGTDVALAARKLRLLGPTAEWPRPVGGDCQRRCRDHDRGQSREGANCNGRYYRLKNAPISGVYSFAT